MNHTLNSNKAKVLKVFPEAFAERLYNKWTIFPTVLYDGRGPLGYGHTPRTAWEHAAQHPDVADKIAQ